MAEGSNRSGDFRYTVARQGASITPMAAVEVFMGPQRIQVLNVSVGGIALLFDREPHFSTGDILDVSTSIRDRAFPVRIEIKGLKGFRVSCSFVNASKIFLGALREFLKPKYLGVSLKRVEEMSRSEGVTRQDVYLGDNRVIAMVWTTAPESALGKLVVSSADLVFEWTQSGGFRTGRLSTQVIESWDLDLIYGEAMSLLSDTGGSGQDRIKWDRVAETTILHYFADILLAWLDSSDGAAFVEELMHSEGGQSGDRPLKFPRVG